MCLENICIFTAAKNHISTFTDNFFKLKYSLSSPHFGIKMVILTPKMIKNVFRKYLHLHGSEEPYQYLYGPLLWRWYWHIFKGHPIRTSIKTDFSIYFKNISNMGWFLIMIILFVLEYSYEYQNVHISVTFCFI